VALQSGLQFWENPEVARGQIWGIWWMVQFHYRFVGQKLPDSERVMSKGIGMMQDPCMHQAKVQVFSDEQPHVTLPVFINNNAGLLFDLVQETQSEQFSSVR
jgi:hypothetical protein